MSHENNAHRKVLNTLNPDQLLVLHRAKISHKYRRLLCCRAIAHYWTCLCCMLDEVFDSTYLYVFENRIESNYPGHFHPGNCTHCCELVDNIHVFYFDQPVTERAARATCCKPACVHCHCCPDCCSCCGQTLIIYSDKGCCCRLHAFYVGLDNAVEVAEKINERQQGNIAITEMN